MNTITVVNPRGQFPALQQAPMALRLDSLDKKTTYQVWLFSKKQRHWR